MATYGPGIDQSHHAKSVSHIIIYIIAFAPNLSMNKSFVLFIDCFIALKHAAAREGQTNKNKFFLKNLPARMACFSWKG